MPLHLAAMYPECSPAVLYRVLAAYPDGARSHDYRWVDRDIPGMAALPVVFAHWRRAVSNLGLALKHPPSQLCRKQLPLHRACKSRATLKKCLPLIESYPEALLIRDWGGNKVGHPVYLLEAQAPSNGPFALFGIAP